MRPLLPELVLGFAATQPVKTYVHRLGALGNNGLVRDTNRGRVVGLYCSIGFWPSHFDKGLA